MCFPYFNLHQNGKQVTSDRNQLTCRILSNACCRVSNGVSAEVHQPDYDTRISILKNILYRDGVEIPRNYRICARNIKSNVRELEGAIISLIAQSSFNKKRKLR
jgi:chromosomal replication initiator protein